MRTTKFYAIYMTMAILCLAGAGWAQGQGKKTEKYESKVLIVGKWGEKPGEYKYRMWEGDLDWPRSMVVDDKEELYILDRLNNRVQHYDKNGEFLEAIPVESYKLASKEDIEKNKGLEYASTSIREIKYLDGLIYAQKNERVGTTRKETFYKLAEGKFSKIAALGEAAKIKERISPSFRRAEIKGKFKADSKFKIERKPNSAGNERLIYDGFEASYAFEDQNKHKWISDGRVIRGYSPEGNLLFEIPRNMETIGVSKQGNLYLMGLYSTKPSEDADKWGFEDYWEGISVKKITLKK